MRNDNTKIRFDALDGLRGLCACCVFFFHRSIWQDFMASGFQPVDWLSNLLSSGSKLGVSIFFVLSAFLFTRKVLSNEISNPITFVVGRFFRIAPLCWLVVLFVIGFAFADNGSIGMSFTDFLKRLVIWLSGGLRDGPTPLVQPMEWWHFVAGNWWTLRHEWLLYALVPAFAGLINKSRSQSMYFGTTVVLMAAFKDIPGVLFHAVNLSFIGGAILAVIVNRPAKKWLLILSILSSAFFLANVNDFPGYIPYAIPATTLTYLVLRDNKLQRLLLTKGIRMVGESSYSIYMLHGIVILLTTKLIRSTTWIPYSITCLVQFLVLLAVSRLVYILIELPGVRIGKYLTTRLFSTDKSTTTTVTN